MNDITLQLKGYRLTTAEILYHMPDHPSVLQTFIWQTLDLEPDYPVIRRFLDYWRDSIEARLHSVRVANVPIVMPGEFRAVGHQLVLH
jgi:uncharacterized protein Usg